MLAWLGKLFKKASVTTLVKEEVPPWVTEMLAAFGKHEVRDYEWLKKWLISDGRTLGDPRKLPWCGDAMETAVKRALPNEPFIGAMVNPYWARNWLKFGRTTVIQKYAIGVFSRAKGGHVGILVGHDDTHYHVLGGNQGDTISVVRIEKGRLLGAVWPVSYPQKFVALPKLSTNVAISVNEV